MEFPSYRQSAKPRLFIETQFSSQESDNERNFNFQPKDVISQASSYDVIQHQLTEQILLTDGRSQNKYESLITGVVQLSHIVDAWYINAIYDTFSQLKSHKPNKPPIAISREMSRHALKHSESVTNLRGEGSLGNKLHQRKATSSSSRDLQRAQVLNQIITKLHSRERSDGSKSLAKSRKTSEHKLLVKEKLKKLESMLKNIKHVNEQSNQKSTVYYTKHYNKAKKSEKYILESSGMDESGVVPKQKVSVFKKLKNEIVQVKTEFNDLKQINQVYRRENNLLRYQSQKAQEKINSLSRVAPYINISTDAEFRQSPLSNNWHATRFIQPVPKYHPSYHQPYTQPYPQSYYHNPEPQPQPRYMNDLRQTNQSKPSGIKCRDARHQNYWRTMVPDGFQINSQMSNIGKQPIVFCFKCGCKCAQKEERSNITQRKGFVCSPVHNLKQFL